MQNHVTNGTIRVLITGGSGFIGTNLVEYYISNGHSVLNVDIKPPQNPAHQPVWVKTDILDSGELQTVVQEYNPDLLLHFAARTDMDGKTVDDYTQNTIGVENIIKALNCVPGLQRVLFASSRMVCKIGYQPKDEFEYCPTTAYGQSKVAGEKIVHNSSINCPWLIVRPTSIWGPWFDIPYKTFFLTIKHGHYFHPGNINILKSFGFVGNTVFQINNLLIACESVVNRKTFYLADYPPICVKGMAEYIQSEMNARKIITLPLFLLRCLALLGDIAKFTGYKNPPLTNFRLDNLLTNMVYDLEPLKEIAGDLPYSMEEGIRQTLGWLYEHERG